MQDFSKLSESQLLDLLNEYGEKALAVLRGIAERAEARSCQ